MNKKFCKFLYVSLLLVFILPFCSCDELGIGSSNASDGSQLQVKPVRMDMEHVKGFLIAENGSGSKALTKADAENTEPYALYSIDEEGNIKLTVFYFEIVSETGEDGEEIQSSLQHELSNAVQIIPTLISDLDKYILFSGCRFQVNEEGLSQEALTACQSLVNNGDYHHGRTFLIRKSDGALFDFEEQDGQISSFFTYRGMYKYDVQSSYTEDYTSFPDWIYPNAWWQIMPRSWTISARGNLFTSSFNPYGSGVDVYKFVDNGDAVEVIQRTQPYRDLAKGGYYFAVDKADNLYFLPSDIPTSDGNLFLDIYLDNGRFNSINLRNSEEKIQVMDMQADAQGNPYVFYFKRVMETNGYHYSMVVASLADGQYQEILTHPIDINDWHEPTFDYPIFLGNIDAAMHWVYASHDSHYMYVQYQPATNSFTMNDFTEDIQDMLSKEYDVFGMSSKLYAAKVSDQSIAVKEYDPLTRSSRLYSLEVDLSSTLSRQYEFIVMDDPYLIIDGRSTADGSYVSFKLNLLTGENNATYSTDDRKVFSFYRIN